VLVADKYVEREDWETVREMVLNENLLQERTQRYQRIVYDEIQSRLSKLSEQQIQLIATGQRNDVRALIWIALCKQYRFIYDFTVEILAKLHLMAAPKVTYDDYATFFHAKAEWHPEIDSVSDKTKSNARQALFLMMRQCGVITDDKELLPMLLSGSLRMCTEAEELALLPGAI
jgi:hypothetical protein